MSIRRIAAADDDPGLCLDDWRGSFVQGDAEMVGLDLASYRVEMQLEVVVVTLAEVGAPVSPIITAVFTTLGSAIGTYVGGACIFGRLVGAEG